MSLFGQSPATVARSLGASRHHQSNAAKQTELYVYPPDALQTLFSVELAGILGIYSNQQLMALKVVFSKSDPQLVNFIYNRTIASQFYEAICGKPPAYWQQVEAEFKEGGILHYVYCLGEGVATTWNQTVIDGRMNGDIALYRDNRCVAAPAGIPLAKPEAAVTEPPISHTVAAASATEADPRLGTLDAGESATPTPKMATSTDLFAPDHEVDDTEEPPDLEGPLDLGEPLESGESPDLAATSDPEGPLDLGESTPTASATDDGDTLADLSSALTGEEPAPSSPPTEPDNTPLPVTAEPPGTAELPKPIDTLEPDVPITQPVPPPEVTFPDIADNLYKAEILRAANTYGIVSGYEDGNFHPLAPISREQIVSMVIEAMKQRVSDSSAIAIPQTLSDPPPFTDVKAGWSATKIQFAKTVGLISGDDQNLFRPLADLSRAQLMAMIRNALQYIAIQEFSPSTPLTRVIAPVEDIPEFTDIPADHWGIDTITQLASFGIATPYAEAGTAFKPDIPAQRDFAAAAIVRMIETEIDLPSPPQPTAPVQFTDITENPYAADILKAANEYKLVSGYEDGSFKPSDLAIRKQAVAIAVNALPFKVRNSEAITIPDELTEPPFVDVPVNDWSATRIYFAKQAGMVSGDDQNRFHPASSLTRAELMSILRNALAYAAQVNFGEGTALSAVMAPVPDAVTDFVDIPANHWAHPVIREMASYGIALPVAAGDTRFAPDSPAQRDYLVSAVVKMIEAPYAEGTKPVLPLTFKDVATDALYAEEINLAANAYQITAGYEDGTFRPAESISREQLVSIVVDALAQMVSDKAAVDIPSNMTSAPFADVPVSSWSAGKIQFASTAGIVSGDEAGLFRPKNDLGHGELMAIISKALDFVVAANYGDGVAPETVIQKGEQAVPTFSDIQGHWAAAVINRMAELGIATPVTGDQFKPNAPTRRDEAIAATVRLLQVAFVPSAE